MCLIGVEGEREVGRGCLQLTIELSGMNTVCHHTTTSGRLPVCLDATGFQLATCVCKGAHIYYVYTHNCVNGLHS